MVLVTAGNQNPFKGFAVSDGRIVPNLGSKVCRIAFQNGVVATGNFTLVDTSKRLISVGKMFSWDIQCP